MTLGELVILPGILLAAFLLFLSWLAARFTGNRIAVMKARKAAAAIPVALLRQQAEVIAAVIAENPFLAEEELRSELLSAHQAWQDYNGRK
jgi:hypothetical protein